MDHARIINQIELETLTSKYSMESIEKAFIKAFVKLNSIKFLNKFIKSKIVNINEQIVDEVILLINKNKLLFDLMALEKIFELFNERNQKKQSGSFYTPHFIVDFIVQNTVTKDSTIIDPACGCGAFLLGSIKQLQNITKKSIVSIIENNIYGIDISEKAINRAKIILTLFLNLNNQFNENIHFNLKVANSLTADINKYFPEIARKNGFDVVIGNPPYTDSIDLNDRRKMKKRFTTMLDRESNSNLYILFFELMIRMVNKESGALGIVVPLSIASNSNSATQSLRHLISKTQGKWFFSFYDRSPDSLFGDNIKTRNSIIFLNNRVKTSDSIWVSSLLRWNSKNRDNLFNRIRYQNLHGLSIESGIPKISSAIEFQTLTKLIKKKEKLGEILNPLPLFSELETNHKDNSIYYYSTAYNWISIFRDIPKSTNRVGESFLPSSITKVRLANDKQAILVYTILSSRLVYWLWLVFGDGFHVTFNFIKNLPINPESFSKSSKNRLVRLGDALVKESIKNPIKKTNHGQIIGNYNMLKSGNIISKIDKIIISELSLNPKFIDFLKDKQAEHIAAGRLEFKNSLNLK